MIRYQLLPSNIPTSATRCLPGKLPSRCFANECLDSLSDEFTKYVKSDAIWKKAYPRYAGASSPPWVEMPYDAIRLNENANVAFADLVGSTLTPVLTYTVPEGYAGVINQNLQIFVPTTGTAFQDGSDALVWYIGVNQCFVSDYTSMNYHEGSLDSIGRVALGAGIRIFPNQIYTYYVEWDGTTALDPDGQVITGINGWIYPIHA